MPKIRHKGAPARWPEDPPILPKGRLWAQPGGEGFAQSLVLIPNFQSISPCGSQNAMKSLNLTFLAHRNNKKSCKIERASLLAHFFGIWDIVFICGLRFNWILGFSIFQLRPNLSQKRSRRHRNRPQRRKWKANSESSWSTIFPFSVNVMLRNHGFPLLFLTNCKLLLTADPSWLLFRNCIVSKENGHRF